MIPTTILDKIFFSENSADGLSKQNALAGKLPFGRLCTIHLPDRVFPYRITKADLIYYRDNVRKLMYQNPVCTNKEALDKYFEKADKEGYPDSFTVLMDLFEASIKNQFGGIFKTIAAGCKWEDIEKEIEGYSVEIFLANSTHGPVYVFEFFPAFTGDNVDQHYGSNIRSIVPVNIFTQNQIAFGEKKGWAMFYQIVFLEKLFELLPKVVSADNDENAPNCEQLFLAHCDEFVKTYWEKDSNLWFLRSEDTVFNFISRFANEFAVQHGLAGSMISVTDSPTSFVVNSVDEGIISMN